MESISEVETGLSNWQHTDGKFVCPTREGIQLFSSTVQFRYLGTTITNQNLIQEEIKRRLNSGNACYHSVQNLLSSRLLSKNM
jgi:hypothetical protein